MIPALRDGAVDATIWPFAGALPDLLSKNRVVIVETYPGEMYHHIGVTWPHFADGSKSGKGSQKARRRNAPALKVWAQTNRVDIEPALVTSIDDGFGSKPDGEDQFDAVVGLFGMLNVLLGKRTHVPPDDDTTRFVEGWIFGRSSATV